MNPSIRPSPLQQIQNELLDEKGVALYIKRDDLIHPHLQGNKWRKLKYNIEEARLQGHSTLLTYGGAYSNHIYATAAAARIFGFRSIGIIRGEKAPILSPTLQFASLEGMELHFLERKEYRLKDEPEVLNKLNEEFEGFYLVPEGGTNFFALKGVAEIVTELKIEFDYLCTPVGTGGTLAGLVAGMKGQKQMLGFSSLKGEDSLTGEVKVLVNEFCGENYDNYQVNFDYHFGGYAKVTPELVQFINDFKSRHAIQLEPVYTGKMFYGIFDLVRKDYFARGSRIVALHTGGLQGLKGFKEFHSLQI